MSRIQTIFILFLLIVFLAGIYVIFSFDTKKIIESKEGMENGTGDSVDENCPNLLVQKGNVLMLYNTNKPVDDTNPIPFFNLDEYIYYLEIQRKKGVNCPVLFLQQENNVQGEDVYRIRPSPFDLQGGLQPVTNFNYNNNPYASNPSNPVQVKDASRENPPYNANNYPGFDPTEQYAGVYTNLDKIHDSTNKQGISDNPMDETWGGTEYTQQMVDSGKYLENSITKPLLYQPKAAFMPIVNSPSDAVPQDIL